MTWLNPPRGHRTTEEVLPSHHNEPGVVWLNDQDGSVWESTWQNDYPDKQGATLRVMWTRCHSDRAELLLKKFLAGTQS
jgi:hypothetical protein